MNRGRWHSQPGNKIGIRETAGAFKQGQSLCTIGKGTSDMPTAAPCAGVQLFLRSLVIIYTAPLLHVG